MKYISALIVQNIINHDRAVIISLWEESLCCIRVFLDKRSICGDLKMAEKQFDRAIFNNSIRIQNDSVMRFYLSLSPISIILHWKIVSTALNSFYSPGFYSNPHSSLFVLVHFQSHNAPNLPPLHISETGYSIYILIALLLLKRGALGTLCALVGAGRVL